MSQFDIYKQKPAQVFTRLVGVNYGTFTIILGKLELELVKYLNEKPKRKCGVKCTMSLADQLLLSLLYMRNYGTLLKVGSDFGISERSAAAVLCPKTVYFHQNITITQLRFT